jgi:hypothetical protein
MPNPVHDRGCFGACGLGFFRRWCVETDFVIALFQSFSAVNLRGEEAETRGDKIERLPARWLDREECAPFFELVVINFSEEVIKIRPVEGEGDAHRTHASVISPQPDQSFFASAVMPENFMTSVAIA